MYYWQRHLSHVLDRLDSFGYRCYWQGDSGKLARANGALLPRRVQHCPVPIYLLCPIPPRRVHLIIGVIQMLQKKELLSWGVLMPLPLAL